MKNKYEKITEQNAPLLTEWLGVSRGLGAVLTRP